jgi:hypothetical protein
MQDWQERIEQLEQRVRIIEEKPIHITVEHQYPDKERLEKMEADILAHRESQADIRDTVKRIEANIATLATKEDLAEGLAALEVRLHGEMSALATRIIEAVKHALE